MNKALGDELSISWREVEPGCDIFYTHDENDFFPEECYVTAYGELFEDCEGAYSTFGELSSCGVRRLVSHRTEEANRR